MPRGLLREQRKRKPGRGQRFGEHEWRRAQTVARSEESGGRRCDGHRHVTGCLVEAERETSTLRPHEIDLHVHSHRPRETLVQVQQHVRGLDAVGLAGPPLDAARRLAGLAVAAGAGALVCSPQEVAAVR